MPPCWHFACARSVTIEFEWEGLENKVSHTKSSCVHRCDRESVIFWHRVSRFVTIEFEWEGLETRSHTQSRHVCTDAIENLQFSGIEYLPSILLVLYIYQSCVPPCWHSACARSVTIEFEWEGLLTRSHTPSCHVSIDSIENL